MIRIIAKWHLRKKIKLLIAMIADANSVGGSLNTASMKSVAAEINRSYMMAINPFFSFSPFGKAVYAGKLVIKYAVQSAMDQPPHVMFLCVHIIGRYSMPSTTFTDEEVNDMVYKMICWMENKENRLLEHALGVGGTTISVLRQFDYDVESMLGELTALMDIV